MLALRPAAPRPPAAPVEPERARLPNRRRALLAAAPLVAATLIACGETDPTSAPPPATAGLLILSGEPGAAELTVHDQAGAPRAVALPARATAWISAGPGGRLAATLDDGSIAVSRPLGDGADPGWRPATDADTDLPAQPLRFATWSPSGTHLAALASEAGATATLTVTVIDPVARAALLLPVAGGAVVAPPAWLGDDRLLVQTAAGSRMVDIVTGEIVPGPVLEAPAGVAIATAPSSTMAIADPAGGAVEVRPLAGWLAGDRGEPEARVESHGEVGSIALTPSGDRLAVVWQPVQGTGAVAVYRRADGWREVARSALRGESARAAVDWLR